MNSEPTKPRAQGSASVVKLPCACANLRRTARLVTQFYEEALRAVGINATQFTLLQSLKLAPGISQKQMAELLGTDSTTLTRTLALLRKRGWLTVKRAADRRALRLGLTRAGENEYERALPYWQSAQKRLRQALGEPHWDVLVDAAVHTARVIHEFQRK